MKKLPTSEEQITADRLLYLVNIVESIPGVSKAGDIVARIIGKMPGISDVIFCAGEGIGPTGNKGTVCEQCREYNIGYGEYYNCYLDKNNDYHTYYLKTSGGFFGFFHLATEAPLSDSSVTVFQNFFNIVAIHFENLLNREQLNRTISFLKDSQQIAQIEHWELDHENRCFYRHVEPTIVCEIFPPDIVITFEDFIKIAHPDERENIRMTLEKSKELQEPIHMIHRMKCQQGNYRFIESRCHNHRSPAGDSIRITWTMQDVTERTLAEQYRLKKEQRISLLLELSRNVSNMSDKDLCGNGVSIAMIVTDSITGFIHMSGSDTEKIEFSFWNENGLSEYRNNESDPLHPEVDDVWSRVSRSGNSVVENNTESKPVRIGGKLMDLSRYIAVPVRDGREIKLIIGVADKSECYDDDDIEQLELIGSDILKLVTKLRAEKQLSEANKNLQSRVREEVNKQRKQEQLLIQQSKLAAMGEMIGAIAHQWRQPLNVLGLLIQELDDLYGYEDVSREYVDSFVQKGMSQIKYMSQTIDDFRNFFKPSRERQIFNVIQSLQEVSKLTSILLEKKNISLEIHATHWENLSMIGFPNEFKQVIINIINNARDSIIERQERETESYLGKIDITIGCVDNNVQIRIRDNGCGIEQSILESLFDPYISTKGSAGSGIGLSMTRTILEENMNGSIRAYNVDNGAEVLIHVPVCLGTTHSD